MSLRKRCEMAAREAIVASSVGMLPSVHDQLQTAIADAIERIAREFAEEVLRDAMGRLVTVSIRPDVDKYVVAAMAATEKGMSVANEGEND